jgi:hypothetical protein
VRGAILEFGLNSMDIYKAIHDLMLERKRLDAVIASLEARPLTNGNTKSRRGRKSMSPEERAQVSRRMAAYWAARRAEPAAPPPAGNGQLPPAGQMPPPGQMSATAGMEASL